MSTDKRIGIITDIESQALAEKWSTFLQAPILQDGDSGTDFFFKLIFTNNKALVRDAENRKLEIDFDKNHLDYQRKGHRGKSEMIAKALGSSKGVKSILDLSVGLAVDSVFLKQIGFKVTGVERSPLLYCLLSEAFATTTKESLKDYRLIHSDSLEFLSNPQNLEGIDAIYFDPMYPHKKKSSLPKQEMVVFRDLVGNDSDAAEVLKAALKCPVKRVVVKRSIQAEELLPGVIHSFKGKVVRYDTYVVG